MMLPSQKMRFAFAGSILIHAIVVLLLALHSTEIEVPPLPIVVNFPSPESKAGGHSSGTSKKKSLKNLRKLPTSDFLPQFSMNPSKRSAAVEALEEPQWSNDDKYNEVNLFSGSKMAADEIRFISSLYQMIDQAIVDNPALSEYNHTGHVFFRFEVDEEDHIDPRTFRASAKDRVLKVIAARAIRTAMRNETGDVHFIHKRVVLNARFSWASHEACNSLQGINDDFMSFCHYAENKRKTFSTGERIGTVAGAIWQNGPWAVEEIKKYNREQRHRETEYDPFDDLKRDPDWDL
jgi:hypothetical protein